MRLIPLPAADREAAIRERWGRNATHRSMENEDMAWLLAELDAAREQNQQLREALGWVQANCHEPHAQAIADDALKATGGQG